ncbi:hypothetical protein EDB83DRAFT_2316746 [Lactarius deliciosus]|nr:hypothetical protein EDB83DRAFT_2316746 [Lactarius deliciosus]
MPGTFFGTVVLTVCCPRKTQLHATNFDNPDMARTMVTMVGVVALGTHFWVATTSHNDTIDDLKMMVKEKWRVDLAQVDVNHLTVWKLKLEGQKYYQQIEL